MILTVAIPIVIGSLAGSARAQVPPPPVPPENPTTTEKAVLGKILFWDEQLSSDGSVACGTCHLPGAGSADPRTSRHPGIDGVFETEDDIFGSLGVVRSDPTGRYAPDPTFDFGRQVTRRYAGSVSTAAWFDELFWEGRAASMFVDPVDGSIRIASGGALESQAVEPILAAAEMAHDGRTWDDVIADLTAARPLALATDWPADVAAAISSSPTYPELFAAAFDGDPTIRADRIAFALAAYERTLVPNQTPWDAFAAGDLDALTPDQQEGLFLFNTQGNCSACHPPPLFSDGLYHNIGVRPLADDLGRELVTGEPEDAGRFKTPSLRNGGLRSRFMHNGGLADLTEVVDFYNEGGRFRENLDPRIFPRGLEPIEIAQIVDFLENGLTDPRVAAELPPFDRPTLRSERTRNPEPFGTAHPGSSGYAPRLIATAPPTIGNARFKIGVRSGLGGARAILAIAADAAPPGLKRDGVPVYVSLDPPPARFVIRLAGVGAGAGYGTVAKAIPDHPGLLGRSYTAQWFIKDPQAEGGLAATKGLRFTVY